MLLPGVVIDCEVWDGFYYECIERCPYPKDFEKGLKNHETLDISRSHLIEGHVLEMVSYVPKLKYLFVINPLFLPVDLQILGWDEYRWTCIFSHFVLRRMYLYNKQTNKQTYAFFY